MVLDNEYGEFEMNNEFVSSVDFIGKLIDLDYLYVPFRDFGKNCPKYYDFKEGIIDLTVQKAIDPPEARNLLCNKLCECIGKYTPIPTAEFASILAALSAEEYESDEAYEALLLPLDEWIERLSRLPAVEVA